MAFRPHQRTSSLTSLQTPGGASDKESTCHCRRHERLGFHPWVRKIPWRRKWHPTPVFLSGESHGQRNLAGYSPWGHEESDMTEGTETHTGMTRRSRWKLHPRVDSREVPVAGPPQPHSALCWQTQAPSPSHIPGHVLFPAPNLLLSTSLQPVFLTHWLLMINQHMLALTEALEEGPAHSRNSEKPDAITGLPSPPAALESFQSYCFHMDGQPAISLTPSEVFHQTGDKDVALSVVHPQK